MDKLTPAARSANMAAIRSEGMKPEMTVRRLVHRLGYRFRLHRKDLPGKPDLVFSGRRKVIFVHGCFWHQHKISSCKIARQPKSNKSYWLPKLEKNVNRDLSNSAKLRKKGWDVLVIWECETTNISKMAKKIAKFLD